MRIGVDAGGTFTDFAVLHDGQLSIFKLRSNPADPASVIAAGVARVAGKEPTEIVHGSTVATNALLERKGARVAFVTSPGFRDLLALGRQNRGALYALRPENRANLVPTECSFEWTGNSSELEQQIRNAHPEAIAICLLYAYADATEEKQLQRALHHLDLYLSYSSEIAPEFREYERASTTVLNAYVGPLIDRYLSRLTDACPFPIQIMQSNGGVLHATEARQHAVRTILSGPAGGVIGTGAMARLAGYQKAIAFDMGGTSTDVSVVEDPPRFATESWIEELPLRVPMLDIQTVGAGGGSLASVDAAGRLRVGPESAGAVPGPACYGAGEFATVTDAHVVLGRIVPHHFLDGSMSIDRERAVQAIAPIAKALRVNESQAAAAIIRIANSNMERAIRAATVERGYDPREFPLVAFGGCGGLHACELAAELGISRVIFPPYASALSAVGMLLAPHTRDYAAGVLRSRNPVVALEQLRIRAQREVPHATSIEPYGDIRYRGQSHELTVRWDHTDPRAPFEEAYQRIYGFHDPQRPIEVVTVRLRANGAVDTAWIENLNRAAINIEPIRGPKLLFDYGTTIYLPDGWRASPHPSGALIATPEHLHALSGGT